MATAKKEFPEAPPPQLKKWIPALILVLLCAAGLYFNSLGGEFIWDDEYLIVRNTLIKDADRIGELFTSDPGAGAGKEYGYYRPLFIFTYAVDYYFWKLNHVGYHISNLAFHLITIVLIFSLVFFVFKNGLWASLAVLFYAVHPVHVEVVSSLAGRVDSLSALWLLSAILCYLKIAKGSKNPLVFGWMLFSFAVGLFTKENGVILPFLILMYHWLFRTKVSRGAFFSLCGTLVFYFVVRGAAFKSGGGILSKLLPGLADRVPGVFVAILQYFRLLLFPKDLHMEYGLPIFSWTDPQVLAGLLLTAGLIFLVFSQKTKRPWAAFGIAWFLIALLPASNLYPLGFFMTERYLYFPSVGFFILAAGLTHRGLSKPNLQPVVIAIAAAFVLFWSVTTVKQNAYWKTPMAFYLRNLEFSPGSVRMNNEMGRLYDKLGEKEKALEYYEKVVGLDPGYPYAYNNIGVILLNSGKTEEAMTWFEKALTKQEAYPDAWNNLANAQAKLGKIEESIKSYKRAIELLPNFAGYYNNLGNSYKAQGNFALAIETYARSLQLDPRDATTHYNLGLTYLAQNQLWKARKSFEQALEHRDQFGVAYLQLAVISRLEGNLDGARNYVRLAQERGVQIPPQLLEALKEPDSGGLTLERKTEQAGPEKQ